MSQNSKIISIVLIGFALFGIYLLQSTKDISTDSSPQNTETVEEKNTLGYKELTSKQLREMLPEKDFTLVDVHIPEQEHIPQTDAMIAYNDVDNLLSSLPDKNAKIVLYCRSGGMSRVAAQELVDRGYTNVYNLTTGANGWIADGGEVLPKGSVPKTIASASDNLAYVALGPANAIGILDVDTNKMIKTIPAGNNPHGVAISKKYIFASSSKMGKKEMLMEPDHDDGEVVDMKMMKKFGSRH